MLVDALGYPWRVPISSDVVAIFSDSATSGSRSTSQVRSVLPNTGLIHFKVPNYLF